MYKFERLLTNFRNECSNGFFGRKGTLTAKLRVSFRLFIRIMSIYMDKPLCWSSSCAHTSVIVIYGINRQEGDRK